MDHVEKLITEASGMFSLNEWVETKANGALDGGKIRFTNITFNLSGSRPYVGIDYDWTAPDGRTGSDSGTLESIIRNYFK